MENRTFLRIMMADHVPYDMREVDVFDIFNESIYLSNKTTKKHNLKHPLTGLPYIDEPPCFCIKRLDENDLDAAMKAIQRLTPTLIWVYFIDESDYSIFPELRPDSTNQRLQTIIKNFIIKKRLRRSRTTEEVLNAMRV